MPTYDYECRACGHGFELFQSMTAKVKRKCPECGKSALQRLIGPGAGFLFKGDGFYITDYRSKSYQDGKRVSEQADTGTSEAGKDGKAKDGKAKDGTGGKDSKTKDIGNPKDSGSPKDGGGRSPGAKGASGEGASARTTRSRST